jgi:hypothetical protein
MAMVCPQDNIEVKRVLIPICCTPSVRNADRNSNVLSMMDAITSARRSMEVWERMCWMVWMLACMDDGGMPFMLMFMLFIVLLMLAIVTCL